MNPYCIWFYGLFMTILVRNDSKNFQSHLWSFSKLGLLDFVWIADYAENVEGRGWESVWTGIFRQKHQRNQRPLRFWQKTCRTSLCSLRPTIYLSELWMTRRDAEGFLMSCSRFQWIEVSLLKWDVCGEANRSAPICVIRDAEKLPISHTHYIYIGYVLFRSLD